MLVRPRSAPGIKVVGRICIMQVPAKILVSCEGKAVVGVDLICQINVTVVRLRRSQGHVNRGVGLVVGRSTGEKLVVLEWVGGVTVVIIATKLPVMVDLVNEAALCSRVRVGIKSWDVARRKSTISANVPG